ncbi:cystathionine beta-synthase/cysteine synthase A [Actinoplanes octamycinicus]|uniref:Cystathionine beta-synthase/cysteine synthase A n=1 Tax=Actinoplanes octamycinicus TaxID=135948 RepID=A0A7W7M6U0_9ACTN|nr:cysteine synthase family protein [Actinoplanes octamycinicus]MBB4739144.1 cystathionine beta-synthase/cysteine synthase A [Actinoplanes octamycinicus]GIE58881.1 cysteine synthase [Actinoplanes octamycinicus]
MIRAAEATVLDAIGATPLFGVRRITGPGDAELLLKWERTNPGGSVKDRPARHIVDVAERLGRLRPGGTIIESSSGNFGISLAMIGAARGYRVIILIDPKTTPANRRVLEAFGADIITVTEQDDTGSYHKTRIALANDLARRIPGSFRPDQCFSLLNSHAHYLRTGAELLAGCEGRLDALVGAVSTGGQLGGLSRYLRRHSPVTRIVGADATGSTVFGGTSRAYLVPGVGLGWTPANLDLDLIDAAYQVSSADTFYACRALARSEGVLAGASSGAVLLAGLREAERLGPGARVVCLLADGGDRYLDTVYDDGWLAAHDIVLDEVNVAGLRRRAGRLHPIGEERPLTPTVVAGLEQRLRVPSSTHQLNDLVQRDWAAETLAETS